MNNKKGYWQSDSRTRNGELMKAGWCSTDDKTRELEIERKNRKILYFDMDGVLINFQHGIDALCEEDRVRYDGRYDECPQIFSLMIPMNEAIESYNYLSMYFNTFILSTPSWNNPFSWMHKVEWVQKYLPHTAYKNLILTHHKELAIGDFLIDDRPNNGAKEFQGKWIHYGSEAFPDWYTINNYLLERV